MHTLSLSAAPSGQQWHQAEAVARARLAATPDDEEAMLMLGLAIATGGEPERAAPILAEVARRIAVLDRYQAFTRGIISARDLVFFATFIGFFLFLNTVLVDQRKTD